MKYKISDSSCKIFQQGFVKKIKLVLKISTLEFIELAGTDTIKNNGYMYCTDLKARSAVDFSRLRLICCCSE
jgi:hypothetical protein